MERLEKLKSKRSTARTAVTKLITRSENLLLSTVEETDFDTLNETLELLLDKEKLLLSLDSEIDDLINDKNEYEKEVKSVEEYSEKIISMKFKIKNRLKKCHVTVKSDDKNCSSEISKNETKSVSAVKLPKLSIDKFSGDCSQFLDFFNCFTNAIDNNESLTKIEKFQFLKSLLIGPAYNVVAGFELNEDNYDSCLKMLKDRYGNRDMIISCHMNKILNLEPVKSENNIKALRKLYDSCEISIRNLNSLGVVSGSYGHLLLPILLKLLPESFVLEYHKKRNPDKDSEVSELLEYIKNELRCREAALLVSDSQNKKNSENNSNSKQNKKVNKPHNVSTLSASVKKFCIFCKDNNNSHWSSECNNLTDEKKRLMLKKEGRCYRCFLRSHMSSACKTKIKPCELCKKNDHNKLFCFQRTQRAVIPENQTIVSNSHCNIKNTNQSVLLQTCCVTAHSNSKSKIVRLLLDSGSEKSFVTNKLVHELNLPLVRKEHLTVFAFGMNKGTEKIYNVYNIKLRSKLNSRQFINVEVLATDIISATTLKAPHCDPEIVQYVENKGWQLADPSSDESEINILLGADYFWKVQKGVVHKINDYLCVANTIFGHTIVGKTNCQGNETINSYFVSVNENEIFDLQEFWKLESLGICDSKDELFSQNDLDTLKLFNEKLNFVNGRYETPLLWKVNKNELKSNFQVAKKRLLGLKVKLTKNNWLYNEYQKILNEQSNLGIIEECQYNESEINTYYMPHRPIIRQDKSTTKIRIVFDASSKDKNEKSLNECLFSGPNLNPNILDIILRFRLHQIAFVSDIERAFLQIQVAEEDRNFLRFLWFDNMSNENPSLKIFRMNRVTFGVTTSPFLLSATIKHHIKGYKDLFEKIVNMLDTSLYVDDLFYGADSVNEAFILSSGAVKILGDACMKLRKFKSNSPELKGLWKDHGINIEEDPHEQNISKILGIIWITDDDTLKVDISPFLVELDSTIITKRLVLQTAAKIYDPMGIISPFVIRVKFLMQELWEQGIDWDSALPYTLTEKFKIWYSEIKDLENFEISRRYFVNNSKLDFGKLQIFIFCDASLKGYGSVAYICDPISCETAFIMSKTRVAPLKKITLPRLELLGALTAARMASYLRELFKMPGKNIFCFSDSQIVLHWIKGSASNWKPFVSNRVREIQDLVAPLQWKFCKGTENPADVASRGCSASELVKNDVWSKGPAWIKENSLPNFFPEIKSELDDEEVLKEQRKTVVVSLIQENEEFELLSKFSSWTKLKRVTAWCLRFIRNIKRPSERITGFLTVDELKESTNAIVKLVQKHEFREELKVLKSNKSLNSTNKLLPLHPFIDQNGIIRVGGRLRNANLSENQKHQIILPKKHHVTDLIVKYFHENYLHSGTQLTISATRQNFWIINARDAVKRNIRNCTKCFRTKSNLASQLMGDLPAARVMPARVFSKVGVDLAGPFLVKPRKGRGIKAYKNYVCLYICFATKAIHLEVLSDLSTETFLASLKRFAARRGKPQEIFSDRGTNFVGAQKELKKFVSSISKDEKIHTYCSDEMIKWNFNPPSAPHFGGLWEAGIKQMKNHLKRTIGEQLLTYEEFLTLIAQIESCLNSRPLVPLSNDPTDLSALTPGHFIIGTAFTSLPENNFSSAYIPPLERWKLLQKIFQSFWKRWSSDYLLHLQQRTKWFKTKPNLKINDLVLIKDDNVPPLKWKLARIIELYPGKDNNVRVVKLKTAHGELKRPIAKLCPLPSNC